MAEQKLKELQDVNLSPLRGLKPANSPAIVVKQKIEHFDFGFFDLYCINVSVTTLTVQRTKIDVLQPLQFPPSLT